MEKAVIVPDEADLVRDLSPEQKKRRRARSVALGLTLAALVAILYAVAILKLGPGAAIEPF